MKLPLPRRSLALLTLFFTFSLHSTFALAAYTPGDDLFTFKCKSHELIATDPNFNEHAAQFVRETISIALPKLYEINPVIAARVEEAVTTRKLIIECQKRVGDEDDKTLAFFLKKTLKQKINLGTTGLMIAALNNPELKAQNIQEMGEEKFNALVIANRNNVIHELFHFSKIGNLNNDVHNDIYNYTFGPEQDNIYACSYLIFPDSILTGYEINTDMALQTCKAATLIRDL